MNMKQIYRANEAPNEYLERAAKCAFAVGAKVFVQTVRDESAIHAEFPGADITHFEPEHSTLHALEMLGVARMRGFVKLDVALCRHPYVVRVVYSVADVRVQIGASKWFTSSLSMTATAMRHALVDAFCSYYDEAIAPYTAA
jgi:hypothetical protein